MWSRLKNDGALSEFIIKMLKPIKTKSSFLINLFLGDDVAIRLSGFLIVKQFSRGEENKTKSFPSMDLKELLNIQIVISRRPIKRQKNLSQQHNKLESE